jgi:hypothetical protein
VSYGIVFRSYADVDHIAPLAWKLLENGETVHAIITAGYDPESDPRLRFLSRYPDFHVHELQRRGHRGGIAGALRSAAGFVRSTLPYAFAFSVRHRLRVIVVEWGYGFPDGYDRLGSPRGVVAVLRSLARSIVHARENQQPRVNFMVAARLLGRPTVCLPHGLSIKLDPIINEQMAKDLVNGPYDWRDRNRFTAYVLNTEHHRQWHVDHAMGDPEAMETWGSLRWSPDWFELNRGLTDPYEWPADANGKLKVVMMVPKWRNLVDAPAVTELVERLQQLDFVSLGLKGHPRKTAGSVDPLRENTQIDWDRIIDVSGADSVPLIAESDAVIDVGSSIGIEAVMQGTVLINPHYLHRVRTLFDVIPGSCVRASSADEVVDYLRRHAAGAPHETPDAAVEELMRHAVYGSRQEPFDVLDSYCERVRRLAGAGRGSGAVALQPDRGGK